MMFDRCRRCLGMGYKGGHRGGKWKVATCRRCGGSGVDPKPETLPENNTNKEVQNVAQEG